MTVTSTKSEITLREKYEDNHSGNEVDNESRKRGTLGGPVHSPEAIAEWQWYTLLCELLIHS